MFLINPTPDPVKEQRYKIVFCCCWCCLNCYSLNYSKHSVWYKRKIHTGPFADLILSSFRWISNTSSSTPILMMLMNVVQSCKKLNFNYYLSQINYSLAKIVYQIILVKYADYNLTAVSSVWLNRSCQHENVDFVQTIKCWHGLSSKVKSQHLNAI